MNSRFGRRRSPGGRCCALAIALAYHPFRQANEDTFRPNHANHAVLVLQADVPKGNVSATKFAAESHAHRQMGAMFKEAGCRRFYDGKAADALR